MTVVEDANAPGRRPWICPFCLLLCEGRDSACARRALARFGSTAPTAAALTPSIDGRPATLDEAAAAAAALLAASRQPLFGGLGTEVAGARALYRLAAATGAISDAAGGEALAEGLRALQDRGQFTTTLAEIRTRADLIVCLQGLPEVVDADCFFERAGLGETDQPLAPQRHVVLLGASASDAAALTRPGVTAEALPLAGDLFDTLARLAMRVAGRGAAGPLDTLAQRLHAARYAVLVGEPGRLPAQGGLLIEATNRIVGLLNQKSRAAALWLGGGNGAATVNQVYAWLSGLPLRSRAGPLGLEHEPRLFGAARLLDERAVDCLLWVACFDPGSTPPATDLPLIVLGRPELARLAARVFIPVSTPGLGSGGHLFRSDGVVLLPLSPLSEEHEPLPTLAAVVERIVEALP